MNTDHMAGALAALPPTSIQEPSIHSGTGLESVSVAPFTAVTVPLPREKSSVSFATTRSRLSIDSSFVVPK